MDIRDVETDQEALACYPVMAELRPHIPRSEWLQRLEDQGSEASGGYRLAALWEGDRPRAVAGYRLGLNLAWGRFLYVDDLVTASDQRSGGYGRAMLAWLRRRAVDQGCDQLHLDSGLQRPDAHRFYDREGMTRTSVHFVWDLRQG